MNLRRAIGGFLLSFVFLLFFAYIIFGAQLLFKDYAPRQISSASISSGVENVKPDAPEINAESAISVESILSGADKIIFEKDSDKKLPIASLTKLMTAIVVLDNYDLSKIIKVDKFANMQPPMKQDVKLGDAMPIENFLGIMLIKSSNKSAYALSELMGEQKFVNLMNKKAFDIGLINTYFADPTGLSSRNISTAFDLTKLAEYILKNYPKIASISMIKELDIPNFGKFENTDQLLLEVPEIVCSKTGFTTEAKGCLLLVINNPKNNNFIINVVLGADDRFTEMKKLINWSNAICN